MLCTHFNSLPPITSTLLYQAFISTIQLKHSQQGYHDLQLRQKPRASVFVFNDLTFQQHLAQLMTLPSRVTHFFFASLFFFSSYFTGSPFQCLLAPPPLLTWFWATIPTYPVSLPNLTQNHGSGNFWRQWLLNWCLHF